ncbi:phosphonate degradation HD-domain oxygenase [Aquiflexum lacus]|uniref:phosphonate degradation HD-domain oxygenase n=1 Tax=Aquiflexum lacus TaxID=2483805 RepID=UPI001894B126|nr:phosphonate degradation HD-domain oxygenase [Aquiflexum lacus]
MNVFEKSKGERVGEVFGLYEKFGQADYIGEPVSQIEHMCQSAQLAEKEGFDEEVILAAFFHDIGHLFAMDQDLENMGGYGVMSHEKLGADFLRRLGFPEKVDKLVENHVQAKRYLTYKYPEYFEKLSEASRKTFAYQGGVMTAEEAEVFENDELFELSLKMRTWDELAKEEKVPLPDLDRYKKMALKVIC